MDFELSEELAAFKATLRRFVEAELIPVEMDTLRDGELKEDYRRRLEPRARELGIWMMDVPEEHGGAGLSALARAVVWQELGRTIALPPRGESILGPTVRPILLSLQGELREKYLLPVLRGEKRACFAQTEPDAGSDPGGMRTTAVRDGDCYVINGVKRFISHADKAQFMQLLAATDRSKGSRGGISCFLVDMDAPGVKLATHFETMMGDRLWEIVLEDVRVPVSQRIGEEGVGFKLGQQWLGIGRVKHGARALGVAERCLQMATAYAKQRTTFGLPLSERQGIQWMLADIYIELEAARLLVYRAAAEIDRGADARQSTYLCKYYADEMAFRAADTCLQIHGGIGLTKDLPIEAMWRQQRSFRITEGPSEVMKSAIARHVLRTYG